MIIVKWKLLTRDAIYRMIDNATGLEVNVGSGSESRMTLTWYSKDLERIGWFNLKNLDHFLVSIHEVLWLFTWQHLGAILPWFYLVL